MKWLFVIAIILISGACLAQTNTYIDTTYQVEISVIASPIISFHRDKPYPGDEDNVTFGYGVFVRGMWHPGRLLAVGLMSGYTFIAEDKFEVNNSITNESIGSATARLVAIPLQLIVPIQSRRFEIGIGMGPYLMLSTIKYGASANGFRSELGLTLFGSYQFSIGNHFNIGPDLRMLYLSYRGIISMMPSLSVRIIIVRY